MRLLPPVSWVYTQDRLETLTILRLGSMWDGGRLFNYIPVRRCKLISVHIPSLCVLSQRSHKRGRRKRDGWALGRMRGGGEVEVCRTAETVENAG